MKYNNKIEALKAVRSVNVLAPKIEKEDSGKYVVVFDYISLKTAKDMVEDIMALGVKYHLEGELLKLKMPVAPTVVCSDCGYAGGTVNPCDSCYRIPTPNY